MIIMIGKMKDGRDVEIVHEDRGTTIPGYSTKDNGVTKFEAYTSRFKSDLLGETYIQCPKDIVDRKGVEYRLSKDKEFLESSGVDIDSLIYAEGILIREKVFT